MKKIVLFLLTMVSIASAKAQVIWQEDFNTVTTPGLPAGWSQYNGDGLTPNSNLSSFNFGTNAWVSYKATGSTNGYAVSTSWYSAAGTSNDWLITPALNPTAGAWLLFDAATPDANFPDGFQVKISTTGNNYTDFTAPAVYSTINAGQSWSTKAIDLASYAGQTIYVAIINNSNDKYLLYMDNFKVTVLPSADAALLAMTPSAGTYRSFATSGNNIPVQGLFQNQGSSTVTSYTVKINDGSTTQSFPQTGNILPYGTQIFSINFPISSVGIKPIKMWVEQAGDTNPINDSTTSEFGGASFSPSGKVVFEEATGTWCGWCPRGAVYMDSVSKVHPDAVLIAVHNADPMVVTAYDNGIGDLVGGYPSVVVGRKSEIDPSEMFTGYTDHQNDFSVADLTLTNPAISGNTMSIKVDVKMAINTNANHDYRLALAVTEEDVHGTTSSWDQANYYSGAAAPSLVGAGLNWDNEANPVPASKMTYNHVARDIVGGFTGVAGSLPASMTAGSTYSYTFNWTIPAGIVPWHCKANVLLINNLSGEIHNGSSKGFVPTAVNDIEAVNKFDVFPNPASNFLNLDFNLNSNTDVAVSMTDLTGKTVYNNNLKNLNGNQGLVISTSSLADGIYMISLKTNEGISTKKVAIKH